jgi:hypothetical protein
MMNGQREGQGGVRVSIEVRIAQVGDFDSADVSLRAAIEEP